MIFDIAASIGSKRHYYILDGKEISPFKVPSSYMSDQYTLTFFTREDDGAFTFYAWDYGERGYGYEIAEISSNPNVFPEIEKYNFLCFVASAHRLSGARVRVYVYPNNAPYADRVEIANFYIPSDDTPRVYKVGINNIASNMNYSIRLQGSSPYGYQSDDDDACIMMHDLYVEGSR